LERSVSIDRPNDASLRHAYGLLLVRQKRSTEALKYLAAAARIEPDNARYAYVYAVALNDAGQSTAAIAVLEACIAAHPYDHDALGAAASFLQEAGDPAKALSYAQRLEEVEPDDPPVRQTIKTLNYQLHCNGS
jgi:Flp pilus assembly protein TadD